MNYNKKLSNNNFSKKLLFLEKKQFTGRLDIESLTGKKWKIYFSLGKIVWADGGTHPNRSWRRCISQYCPRLDFSKIPQLDFHEFECWNYLIITLLLKRSLINQEQVVTIIQTKINDILFDIFQQQTVEKLEYTLVPESAHFIWKTGIKVPIHRVVVLEALKQVQKIWFMWEKLGFTSWYPDTAPIISKPEELQKYVSPAIYQKLVHLMDGQRTLRDLAVKLNINVVHITKNLANYINKGYLELVEITDIPDNITPFLKCSPSSSNKKSKVKNVKTKLIICIDDSSQICKTMEQIIVGFGYKFISIQDSLHAVSHLLKCNPDMIFLDLIMPIVNGYEICSQLRRISKFKQIPIVILTSNDGMVDRVRAKVVGASAFLPKPITPDRVKAMIEKFLPTEKHQEEKTTETSESSKISNNISKFLLSLPKSAMDNISEKS